MAWVAVPLQVPANEAGILAPADGVACVVCVTAGLAGWLAWVAGGVAGRLACELLPWPAGGPDVDPRGNSTTPRAMTAAAATPQAARSGPRLDLAAGWPGADGWPG
jgi:hypothetical protein